MSSIFNKKNKIENTTYDDVSSLSHTKWNCKYWKREPSPFPKKL